MADPRHTVSTQSTAVPPLQRTPISEWQRALDDHDERLAPELEPRRSLLAQLPLDDRLRRDAGVVELAAPGEKKDGKNTAPIHIIFFDRYEQRLLLEGLARNFPPILKATPPLYDFLTQFAGFDSPVASFLSEEIREFKNYPMTCQSLQSVATYLKFDWGQPQPFR